jgi:hypothetical protein
VSDCALQDQYVQSSDLEPAERPSGLWAKSCESLLPRLCRHCDLDLRRENQQLFFGAQTGFMALLQVAEDRLLRGQLDACLVGASESCLDSAFLVAAASQGALKTSNNPVGFLPGEGAAFFLLERPQSAGERQLASLLDIRVAEKEHQGRSGGFDGARLAKAMHATLASTRHLAPDVPLLALVGDLNGEEQKAWEWGNALVRLLASPEYKDTPSIFPALAFGETGAASSALALGLAICSRKRLPAQSGYMLLWASCRSGAKGALLLLI